MKKTILSLIFISLFSIASLKAAVTIRYYNKDSETHKMEVKMSGSTKSVEFGSSRTSSVTIQGSSTTCTIITDCGSIEVKDGDSIEIKDGCITIK